MTDHPPPHRSPGHRVAATLGGVLLAVSACGTGPDGPLDVPGPEVRGGAVGPDAQVNEDVDLLQVQLEYPLDTLYEKGEDARLFLAIANTGEQPATLTEISGPDFGGVTVEKADGEGLPLQVDANDNLYIGAEGPPNVTLMDLERELRSSQSIPVTFTFAEAGEVTIDVVVSAEGQSPTPTHDFPDDDPDQDPSEDATSTTSQPSTSQATPTP